MPEIARGSVLFVAIKPRSPADAEKLSAALTALVAENPSLQTSTDAESGQIILKGASERQLDEAIGELGRTTGLAIDIGAPQVAYRETVSRPIEVDFTYKTQSDGARQFARVKLHVAPIGIDADAVFMAMIPDSVLPADYVSGLRKGVESALEAGVAAGFPVVGVRVALVDCAFHEADSSELAFEIASRRAMREALLKGGAALLEPMMTVVATVPQAYAGATVGDLKSRRAEVRDQVSAGETVVIDALTPLANLFGYANSLRSFTGGRGTFTTEFAHYAVVPTPDHFDPTAAPAMALRP